MQSTLSYNPSKSTAHLPWLMLFSRIVFFLTFQILIAIVYWLAGVTTGWEAAAAWWPVTATLTNVVCILLLVNLLRQEGQYYWDLFKFKRETLVKDVLITLGLMIVGLPLAIIPNIALGQWLFGNAEAVLPLLFRPLPLWAIAPAVVLFPITIGLAELPTYFGYVLPRLEARIGSWQAVALSAVMLSAQHMTLPLLFDARFMAWRLFMFLPFAIFVGIVIRWRPRLLPYLVVIHALLDLNAVLMVLSASKM